MVGVDSIPIDNKVLSCLDIYGIDKSYAKKSIEANRHNHVTTTYYLVENKYMQTGELP
jgi:5'-AMP-activated protein kinase catalytic alpha subunit